MSLETIQIYRDFQVINGFVQVPPNFEKNKNKVTIASALAAIAGSTDTSLSQGSGRNHGWTCGAQTFLRLPGLTPGTDYTTDPAVVLLGALT